MNFIFKLAFICLIFIYSISSYSQCITGLKVETFSGDPSLYSCPGQEHDIISIKTFTAATPVLYVITDVKDTIRSIALSSQIDFSNLKGFEYRIYGYSYKGTINKVEGQALKSAIITSLCAARSINFITVFRGIKSAPIIESSSTPIYVCAPDAKPDIISIDATLLPYSLTKYIVTDDKNNIVALSDQNNVDVNSLNCETCKLYAASYIGKFSSKVGESLTSVISSNCAAVSENFITVLRGFPKGGKIQLIDTTNPVFVCKASIQNQILNAQLINSSGGKKAFVLTDTLNKVLTLQKSSFVSALALSAGTCKIWGLTYTGILTPSKYVGRLIKTVLWSDDCFALTENSLTIIKSLPNGGNISFLNSSDRFIQVCKSDLSQPIKMKLTGAQGAQFVYVLTDPNAKIISWSATYTIDPKSLSFGDYRIYNLAYTGNLILNKNDAISAVASDDCYDYSDDYVNMRVANDAGAPNELRFIDQSIEKFVCAFDSASSVVKFNYANPLGANSIFILTDGSGNFISSFNKNEVDFSKLSNMKYKIYAATYSGSIQVKVGENINAGNLFSGCYKLTETPLVIDKGTALAGKINFSSGKDSLFICTKSMNEAIQLKSLSKHNSPFVFIITSPSDTVTSILAGDSFAINQSFNGICKFWGLAYTGVLNLKPGDFIKKTNPSTGCADLSSNALTLIKDRPIGGAISMNNGDSSYQICFKDGRPDILSLITNTTSSLLYQFVATDKNDHILAMNINKANLELYNNSIAKIYGISYLGEILAKIGDDIKSVAFTAECFEISRNYITISSDEIRAGNIRSDKKSDIINYCLQSQMVDTIRLASNGAAPGTSYRFIGIQSDTIKFVSNDGVILSSDLLPGTTVVYGIAFKGKFLAKSKDKLSLTILADSCYGVSQNSLSIGKYTPNAGRVTSGSGSDIYLCPGDGVVDFLSLSHEGAAPLNYGYIITNSVDSIIGFSAVDIVDLDTFPLGICKIYGISYQGSLQIKNKTIQSINLATDCFAVSANSINVYKSTADGGRIMTTKGDTVINICVEDLAADTIRFRHSSTLKLKYTYLITDTQNKLQSIIDENDLHDFNGSDPGECRIYGVSYGGFLNVFKNDDVTKVKLSSGCYDISDNFLTLNKSNTGNNCKNFIGSDNSKVFLKAFPNPASEFVKISIRSKYLKTGLPTLTLVGAFGAMSKKIILDHQTVENESVIINTRDLTSGIYFLMFKNGYIFDNLKIIVIK